MALVDYEDIIHRCFRCGYCKLTEDYSQFNCPPYHRFRFETYGPGGMLWLTRAWMTGDLNWNESLAKVLYSCSSCNNCVEHCKFTFREDILNIILAAREDMVQDGLVLPQIARFFRNLEATGNPFRNPPGERGKWADGTGISQYTGQEYLFYVGCLGSYDARAQDAAKALGNLLMKAGVSFGILGSQERCDGNEVYMLGEKRIFNMLEKHNSDVFADLGLEKIITLSPHSYNAFT